jgi:hypothetical protein
MLPSRFKRRMFICTLALCFVLTSAGAALAQGQSSTSSLSSAERKGDVDLEVQLHLLLASNTAGEGAKLPAKFDAVVKQLSSTLPYSHYRWASTFLNRVNIKGNSSIKGIAGPLLATTAPSSATPSFYDLMIGNVGLTTGTAGQELIRFNLRFGARLPVVVGGGAAAPTVNYESTGIDTLISVRENEPVVVGTMSLGPSNETLVLVVSVKKIG